MKLQIIILFTIFLFALNVSALQIDGQSFTDAEVIQGMKDVDKYMALNSDYTITFD
jgi:hypothetical protein